MVVGYPKDLMWHKVTPWFNSIFTKYVVTYTNNKTTRTIIIIYRFHLGDETEGFFKCMIKPPFLLYETQLWPTINTQVRPEAD